MPTFISIPPPASQRERRFGAPVAALADNNGQLRGCTDAGIWSAGLIPWVSVWWWEVLLWAPFQLVLKLKK